MSVNHSLANFAKQLQLKLTLGQNYQQELILPECLKEYIHPDADLLTLNTHWSLFQIAAQQASETPEQQLNQLKFNETPFAEMPQTASVTLERILNTEFSYYSNYKTEYLDYFLKICILQNWTIPPNLVQAVITECKNSGLLFRTLPERSYQLLDFVQSPALKGAYILKLYQQKQSQKVQNQQNDEVEIIEDAISKLTKVQLEQLLFPLNPQDWTFASEYFDGLWKKMNKDQRAEWVTRMPYAFFAPHVHNFEYNPKKIEALKNQNIHLLYLQNPEHPFTQQVIEIVKQFVQYDPLLHLIKLKPTVEINDQLFLYGLIDHSAESNIRKLIKEMEITQKYLDFSKSEKAADYLYQIFEKLPLVFWQSVFTDWEMLFELKFKHQRSQLLHALVECCRREQNTDLANQLFDFVKINGGLEHFERLLPLLNAEQFEMLLLEKCKQINKTHHRNGFLQNWIEYFIEYYPNQYLTQTTTAQCITHIPRLLPQDQRSLLADIFACIHLCGYPEQITEIEGITDDQLHLLQQINQLKQTLVE